MLNLVVWKEIARFEKVKSYIFRTINFGNTILKIGIPEHDNNNDVILQGNSPPHNKS
jgi:hypothetical protein